MFYIFLENTITDTNKTSKNLRYILSLSLFPRTTKQHERSIEECNRKFEKFLVVSPDFTCFATKRKYIVREF